MTPRAPAPRRVPKPVPDVVVEAVEPSVDCGRFACKATVGDPLTVSADVFAHGHDVVRAALRHRPAGARVWRQSPMTPLGNDRFAGIVVPDREGVLEIEVIGELDVVATWARDAKRRWEAGRPDSFDAELGARLLTEAADLLPPAAHASVRQASERLGRSLDAESLDLVESLADILATRDIGLAANAAAVRFKATVAPTKAAFSTWYELFPRSSSLDPRRPGRLSDVVDRLDYVAELGCDVLYLPPIHPIGVTARKGKGNTTTATPGDVGSPWAIGGPAGGHDAVAPELGTMADLEHLVAEAKQRGIDVALDLAFQCSPDHPWVADHPEWFRHRPDGTIACAENPPKRYEDIFPIDFTTGDREGLWRALHAVTSWWADHGIGIFRVDNPHTKPFAFWEWLIAEIKRDHPGTIFLSEAFTRPKVMHRLAKLGFDQSYTYFAWRYEKWDLTEYFNELAHGPGRAYFRPNVWPNTPDILAQSLQNGGHASFIARLVLAGGLSANYGLYGPVFELMWDTPAAPGSEEYLHSEKYQVHHHDWDSPRSLRHLVARVNLARRAHPALQRDRGLRFLPVDNEQIIAWRKGDDSGEDVVIGVVNLDSRSVQMGFVQVDLTDVGIAEGEPFEVRDVLTDATFRWQGGPNFVMLDPTGIPAHLLALVRSP